MRAARISIDVILLLSVMMEIAHFAALVFSPSTPDFRECVFYPQEGLASLLPHGESLVTWGTSVLRVARTH
jgi:hypothetical protein